MPACSRGGDMGTIHGKASPSPVAAPRMRVIALAIPMMKEEKRCSFSTGRPRRRCLCDGHGKGVSHHLRALSEPQLRGKTHRKLAEHRIHRVRRCVGGLWAGARAHSSRLCERATGRRARVSDAFRSCRPPTPTPSSVPSSVPTSIRPIHPVRRFSECCCASCVAAEVVMLFAGRQSRPSPVRPRVWKGLGLRPRRKAVPSRRQ